MDLLVTIVLAVAIAVIYYFGKQYVDWQKLRPIMVEIANIILRVENERKLRKNEVDKLENVAFTGEEKKSLVEKTIEKELPEADKERIKRSPFKSIGKIVEYVFLNIAQPIILGRLAGKR